MSSQPANVSGPPSPGPSYRHNGKSPRVAEAVDQTATAVTGEVQDSDGRDAEGLRRRPRWGTVWDKINPAPSLPNSGSVARDHLANERTWLAYLRTSLAVASAGVAMVQLFAISTASNVSNKTIRRYIRPLGGTLVLIGFFVLILGAWRYFQIQLELRGGKFPPARRTVAFLTTVMVVVVAITFGFLLGLTGKG